MKYIPSLGIKGWLKDPESIADEILGAFLTTNTSQSTMHRRQNLSMQHILQEHTGDMLGLETTLREQLGAKFKTVFGDKTVVNVDVESTPEQPDKYSIKFNSEIFVDGREYIVGKLVNFEGSKLVKISEINNG